MIQHIKHITLFLIAAVFTLAIPQASAQTFGGTPIKNTAELRYSVNNGPAFIKKSNTTLVIVESFPQMTLTKTVSSSAVQRGEEVSFRIIITNTGNVPLTSIEVYDTLHTGFRSVRTDKGIIRNGVLIWPVEPLRPLSRDSLTITVGFTDAPGGTQITNRAYAFDEDAPMVSDSASFLTTQSFELSAFMKKLGPAKATTRDTVTYVIDVENDGIRSIFEPIIIDTIRAPMRLIQAFDGATIDGNVIRWTTPLIDAGAHHTVRVRVAFDAVSAPQTVSNTVHLTTATMLQENRFIHSATASTLLEPPFRDMTLSKTVSKSSVALNDTATYIITARNTGNLPISNVQIADTIDARYFVLDSLIAPAISPAPGVITATYDTLRPGATATMRFRVRTLPQIMDQQGVVNRAVATGSGLAAPRTASAIIAITDTVTTFFPSVVFTKTGPTVATSRDTLRYIISVRNTGPTALKNAVIRDTLDADMVLVSASDSTVVSGNIVSWPVGTLAPNETRTRTISVITRSITATRTLTNTAGFFAYRTYPVGTQASTTVAPAVIALSLTKSASSDSAYIDSNIRYTLLVRNTGNVTLTDVRVTDTLRASYLDRFTASSNAIIADSVVTARFLSLAPGATATVTINAHIKQQTPEGITILNVAHARANESGRDVTDSVTVVTTNAPFRSLEFLKTASKDSALLGSQVTYTFHVTNTGNLPLTNIIVTDTIAANIFDRSIILFPGVDRQGNVITAFFPSLLPGETDSAFFRLRLLSDLASPTTVTNTAHATADSLQRSRSSAVTLIGYERISMTLAKKASADTVTLGDIFFYTITISNDGSKDLSNVIVRDTIPPGYLTPLSVITNGTLTGNVVTGTFPFLFTDETKEIIVQVRANRDTTAKPSILNRAYALSDETGPVPVVAEAAIATFDPNTGQVGQPAMYLTKTVERPLITIGENVTYTLTVRNAGNVTLHEVLVIDTIPGVLLNPTISADGTIVGPVARWILDSLQIGESVSMTLTAQVPSTMAHRTRVLNTAYGSSNETPRDTATASFTGIIPAPDQSCRIHLQVAPALVIGNGQEAAVFRAFISDSLGRPKPDGTPVVFTTPTGFFSNGMDSIVVGTVDGYAVDSLRAVLSGGGINSVDVLVSVEDPGVCSASEVVKIVFYPGALYGVVLDNKTRDPYEGAVVIVYSSDGHLIANVSTGPDGTYLIPVPKTDEYRILIITTDNFGDPVTVSTTVSIVVPGTGGTPAVPTKNLITGKIFFYVSGEPIVAQQIKVILSSEQPIAAGSASPDDDRITVLGRVDSTQTDSTGTYYFKDVLPGTYSVVVDHPFLGGQMAVGSIISGQMIVDANIPIVLNQQLDIAKTGPTASLLRDTVTYAINVTNTGTFSVDSVVVTDSLDAAMEFVSATAPAGVLFGYDATTHQVVWNLGRMDSTGGIFTAAPLSVTVRFADSISTNRQVSNLAHVMGSNISPRLESRVATNIVRPDLAIRKTAVKRVVEIGDIATYTISVTNNMPTFPITNVILEDTPPLGFSYANGSSFIDSLQIPDPTASQRLTWMLADTLQPGATITLSYKMIVGAGALEGNGINTAEAIATTASGRPLRSGTAQERIDVRAGLFADRGLIIGKVFYDENRNAYQDSGEVGVKGIEIMTSTGMRVITGDDGKYSIPDVQPGEHVLRVRERSLPPGGVLIEGWNDFAGDASSRFVQVTPAGIARADFYLFQTSPDSVVLEKTIAKVGAVRLTRWTDPMNLVFIEDERRAPMKLTGVSFETAKAELRTEASSSLGELAEIMREYPDVSLLIVGHTDTLQIRTRQFPNNMVLSLARANAVKRFLFEREGIDSARIRTLGLGELQPIAWNRTSEGRALNRRVEFYFNDDFEPQPLSVASILMQIAIDYDGSVPARSISFTDKLDARLRFVKGSGVLGDSTVIEPTKANGEIRWTIPGIGKRFSDVLTYRVEIDKPDNEVLSAWTTTQGISIETDSTVVTSDTTISTINHVAVAVRGTAANYVMSGILFRVGSADLRPAARSALDGAADYLRSDPTATLVVEGHTDATPIRGGRFRSNVELSRARAEAVIDILVNMHGIARSRMQAFGFGALRPVASNETADGRERNRRVELRLYTQEFSSTVIQAGRVDSSRATVARLMPRPSFDDGVRDDTLRTGEQYRLTLRIVRPVSAKTASLTIVDSLSSSLRLVDGSLEALSGVETLSAGPVIEAIAEQRAEVIAVTFIVEVVEPMRREDLIRHQFYSVRNERTGDTIIDRYQTDTNGPRTGTE